MTGPVPAPRVRGGILLSILLLLVLVGVAPLLWTSYKLVSGSREILELDTKTLQLDKARSLSQQVAVYVRAVQLQVAFIARTLEVDLAPGGFARRVERIREERALERYLGGQSAFSSVSVVDATGAGARSGVVLNEASIERLTTEGWRQALNGRGVVGPPVISAALQEPVLVVSEPVRAGAAVEGVVSVVASLAPLWSATRDLSQAGFLDVYVVDARGLLVAHSDPARLQADPDFSDIEIVKLFLQNRGRAGATVPFTAPDKDGRPVKMLGTYASIADTGWGVIVQVAEDKAYYTAIEMRNQSLLLVGAVALLAAVLGTLLARQISQPIRELARGARRLAGGDYATRVKVGSRNEVGVLGEAFNQMGEEIQKAIEEIRKAADTNKELFMGSIRMLANAIDEKDPYTRGHSERVAFYSAVMARHMGMSEEEVEKVHLSGIIHDVGKIGIEDKILRKAAALTEEEYEVMKQHPRKGEHILDAVPRLKAMAGPGLQHHENWDGSGYPDGLKGEEIPLLGRIVSVADAFDAMTTDRPYSKAMTFEAALARLRFLAGKKFDSACVDAIEKASAAGDLTPAKARRASVAARANDLSPQPVGP